MDKLKAIFDLFRYGEQVTHADIWKAGTNASAIITGIILALLHLSAAFGHPVPMDLADIDKISAGIAAAVLFVMHNITNHNAGLLPAKPIVQADKTATSETRMQQDNQAIDNPQLRGG